METATHMSRVHVIISGDVQGVGFRAWAMHLAKELHLVGWVTNREDDTVEVVAEGEKLDLVDFANQCHKGPELAAVKTVDIQWEKPTGEFMSFEVVY